MNKQRKYLGVVYEGVRDYNGLFGKTCNDVLTVGVLLVGLAAIIVARHMTKIEGRLKKIEKKLGG